MHYKNIFCIWNRSCNLLIQWKIICVSLRSQPSYWYTSLTKHFYENMNRLTSFCVKYDAVKLWKYTVIRSVTVYAVSTTFRNIEPLVCMMIHDIVILNTKQCESVQNSVQLSSSVLKLLIKFQFHFIETPCMFDWMNRFHI